MGNLSNLYVSKSFQSLIHLGTDSSATSTLTTLQDGLGNSIGIEVNTAGNLFLSGSLTASLQQGYVWVGNASGKTTTVSTSSFGGGGTINTGSLVTTASFNSYTSSNNQRVSSLESATASLLVETANLEVFSASALVSISNLNASSASQQVSINALNSASSSLFTSASLALLTASFNNGTRNLTFTKGDTSTFSVNIPDVSGSTINTGSFATTGSNSFVGNQTIAGGLTVSGSQPITFSGSAFRVDTFAGGGPIVFRPGTSIQFQGNTDFTNPIRAPFVNVDNLAGGGYYGFNAETTGRIYQDFSGSVDTRINNIVAGTGFATTGSNTFNGNQTITGSLGISGNITASLQQGYVWVGNASGISTTVATSSFGGGGGTTPAGTVSSSAQILNYGIFATTGSNTFRGNQTITGSVFISSSGIGITNESANNAQYLSTGFGGVIGTYKQSDFTEIGLAIDGNTFTTNWANGPIIYVNNTPGDTYEGVFGFQNKTNYTDGRITALKRLDVSGSISTTGTFTSSLQQGHVFVGNASGRTTTVATSSFGAPLPSGVVSGSSQITALGFATTGSNTFTGNQTITGSVIISSSAANDLIVNGTVRVTGSGANNANITQNVIGLTRPDSSGTWQSLDFGGYLSAFTTDFSEISIVVDGASYTGNWTNGPAISVNDPADTYPAMIGFQNKTNWTDGRVTVLKPLDVRGNTTITGSLTISSSAATDLFVIGNAVITGSLILSSSAATELNVIGNSIFTGSVSIAPTHQVLFATGSNQQAGTAVLDGANPGTVTVSNSLVTANSIIMVSKQTLAHTNGYVAVSSKGAGTFTITSNHNGDNDTVGWFIINNS